MTSTSQSNFKSPPIVECIAREHCLGVGRKIHDPDQVCFECLRRHDPQQLRIWANNNRTALSLVEAEVIRKQGLQHNIETHGRFLCAFEDPDFQHCRWRRRDLNLRGSRLNCTSVRRKGKACKRCWKRHLHKIGIVQYFTPSGLCLEEADEIGERPEGSGEDTCGGEDDVEGYNIVLD